MSDTPAFFSTSMGALEIEERELRKLNDELANIKHALASCRIEDVGDDPCDACAHRRARVVELRNEIARASRSCEFLRILARVGL